MSYSTFWEPPTRNFRERETAWVNSTYYAHQTFCGCDNFSVHLFSIVHSFTRNSTPEAIAAIIKDSFNPTPCLTFGDTQHGAAATQKPGENLGDVLENLEEGELEELFQEEEPTTPATENTPDG